MRPRNGATRGSSHSPNRSSMVGVRSVWNVGASA
jgi:hypothetical protein